MSITRRSTLTDVCFAVCTALQRSGTVAVLAGGSAATYYAPDRYQSADADFVIVMSQDTQAAPALRELGFTENDGIYRHSETEYTLNFPPGPLSVGGTVLHDYETIRRGSEVLHILSRTDSVCDRLSAFYHWGDRGSLRTALDVAQSGKMDLRKLERWSKREGALDKFAEFARRYHEEARKKKMPRA